MITNFPTDLRRAPMLHLQRRRAALEKGMASCQAWLDAFRNQRPFCLAASMSKFRGWTQVEIDEEITKETRRYQLLAADLHEVTMEIEDRERPWIPIMLSPEARRAIAELPQGPRNRARDRNAAARSTGAEPQVWASGPRSSRDVMTHLETLAATA